LGTLIYKPKNKNIVKLKKFLNEILGTNKYIKRKNSLQKKENI